MALGGLVATGKCSGCFTRWEVGRMTLEEWKDILLTLEVWERGCITVEDWEGVWVAWEVGVSGMPWMTEMDFHLCKMKCMNNKKSHKYK